MSLACNTPVGRTWIERQREIGHKFAAAHDLIPVFTPDRDHSPIDALFSHQRDPSTLVLIAEIKGRELTFQELGRFGSYLVTFEKLIEGRSIARSLRVPYVLIVGLTDRIIWWKVCSSAGEWLTNFSARHSTTQNDCNGGEAFRCNSYLGLERMRVLE